MNFWLGSLLLGVCLVTLSCSTALPVKTQAYARLNGQRVFEYDFPKVWYGIEQAFRKYQVTKKTPSEVTPIEMKKITERTLETDWIYGESRDKYEVYKIN